MAQAVHIAAAAILFFFLFFFRIEKRSEYGSAKVHHR
jgi:hypothetical protein